MDTEREAIRRMLVERGVEGADALIDGLSEDQLDAAYGAIAWWDDMPHTGPRAVGSGLLVKKIRDGGLPGYKRPHDRGKPDGTVGVTDKRLRSMRGVLCSPDAVYDRESAAAFYREAASKLDTPVQALIDAAMGPEWQITPPHPASLRGWQMAGWEYPKPVALHQMRYALWCQIETKMPNTRAGVKHHGESQWSFACRFWDWDEHEAEIQKQVKRAAEAEAKAKALREEEERLREAEKQAEIQRNQARRDAEAARRAAQAVPDDDQEAW